MIPDMEDIVGDYLRGHSLLAGNKVFGRPPGTCRVPWVLLTQLDAPDIGHGLEYLTDHMLQLDCYAGADATASEAGQKAVNDLARACRQALHEMPEATLAVTVTGVVFTSMLRNADGDTEPAQERVTLTTEVQVHP